MLPSEILRKDIAETYSIDIEKYAWSEELKKEIFSIELDEFLETHAKSLGEIYKLGFNIGHCGLTSRYLLRKYDATEISCGKAKLLVGTEASPNGEHAWINLNEHIIDTTLMIIFPQELLIKFGYIEEKRLSHDSARILSEYDVYDLEYEKQEKATTFTKK